MKTRQRAALSGLALALAVSTGVAGCGGGSSKSSAPGTPGVNVSGGNGFCSKLVNADQSIASDLSSATTSGQSALADEAAKFKSLASSAPSAIQKPLSDLANFLGEAGQAQQDAASGNTASLQKLEADEAGLGGDEGQLTQWETSHCHAS